MINRAGEEFCLIVFVVEVALDFGHCGAKDLVGESACPRLRRLRLAISWKRTCEDRIQPTL